jgi:hypothetical protein
VLKNTTSYGVFIDLGGLRLIHITDHWVVLTTQVKFLN